MATTSKILTATAGKLVREVFDPRNPKHMTVAQKFLKEGRQDPELRFELEHPFLDIRSLVLTKIADAYSADFFAVNKPVERPKVEATVVPFNREMLLARTIP